MRMRGAIKKGAPQVLRGVSEETGAAQATSVSGGRSWDALPKIQKKKHRDLKLRAMEGKEWRCKLWHIQNMDLLKEESKSGTVAVPTNIWLLWVDETCGSRPLTTSPLNLTPATLSNSRYKGKYYESPRRKQTISSEEQNQDALELLWNFESPKTTLQNLQILESKGDNNLIFFYPPVFVVVVVVIVA